MAIAPGYTAQVAPGGTAMAPPQASPAAFGAGVGEGIAELGDALHRGAVQRYVIEQRQIADQEATDFAARFAKARELADQVSADAKANAAAGGVGHAQAMADWWQQQREGLLQGITHRDVQQRAQGALDNFGASFVGQAEEWQAAKGVAKAVTDVKTSHDVAANRVRTNPASYGEELTALHHTMDALTGIPEDERDQLIREGDQRLSNSVIDGMIDHGQLGAAKALLASGKLDDVLTPEQIDQAHNRIDVETRREQAMQEHQVALAKAQINEQTATLKARVAAGDQPAPAEFDTAIANAKSIGDESSVVELTASKAKVGINRMSQPWLPDQYRQAIDQLEAKGDKRSSAENIELAQLKEIAPKRIEDFNRDPGSWAALNGNPRPKLDITDPQSIAATIAWRNQVQRATGRAPSLITDQDARNLQQEANGSPAERLAAANQIAIFGGFDAIRVAKQVAPSDPLFARLTTLAPEDRAPAINGAAARKSHPQLIDGQPGKDAAGDFQDALGSAAALMDQGDVGAAFEIARNLYADWAVRNGKQDYSSKDFGPFVQRALGATRGPDGAWRGGLGEWNGAKVILPSNVSQSGFDHVLSNIGWRANDPHAPAWANHVTMTPAEVRRFTPVLRPDGRYEFHGRDGSILHARNGGVWILDVANSAQRMGL